MEERPAAPVTFADLTLGGFVERLASAEPVPGGGAASAVAGALGAALVSMVASLSLGRERYAAYEPTLTRCQESGHRLAATFLELANRDAEAYAAYGAALKMPRASEPEQAARRAAMQAAARVAAEAPLECVRACVDLATEAEALAGRSNVNAASDVLVASLLAQAGAKGAGENVRINLPATGDEAYADGMLRRLDRALHDVDELVAQTREAVLSGQSRESERP